ncbi:hypothetical protein M153_73890001126, partial [Pseudoloma neurophilia]
SVLIEGKTFESKNSVLIEGKTFESKKSSADRRKNTLRIRNSEKNQLISELISKRIVVTSFKNFLTLRKTT